MYGLRESRRIPDVDERNFGRSEAIASREPVPTRASDFAEASFEHGAPREEQILDDVRERVDDFAEWRTDYSRQLARYPSMLAHIICLSVSVSLSLLLQLGLTALP